MVLRSSQAFGLSPKACKAGLDNEVASVLRLDKDAWLTDQLGYEL